MLARGTELFIQTPDEFADRILHPAEVVGEHERGFIVELKAPLALAIDDDVNLYYEVERHFMQQPARVIPLPPVPDEPDADPDEPDDDGEPQAESRYALETTGNLISAECREVYRVSTVTADLTAALADEQTCRLTDISATGFSVIASAVHAIGVVVPATLRFEDKQFTGRARIQSIKQLITDETRYGLRNLDDKGASQRDLEKGQQTISAAMQRLQLRRKAGNGG